MRARALPALLLLAAPLLAGEGPETDPFLAALAGKSGPEAVAAPDFDPDLAAVSWTIRSRREIVDGLAARLLRGEAKGWTEPAKEAREMPPLPSRVPDGFDPAGVPVTDRLAAWTPADAAVVLFGSLREAEEAVEGLAKFLPAVFPVLCGDPPGGRRDALRRGTEMLLLPTIWGANPNVRTGTRQVALVVSDPDVRWAPDIALVAEVDDASLVRFHRQASLRWEERRDIVLRTDGLDAVSDDGSIRSFFAMEGGVAVWSTTKSLRARILAAGAGRAPSLLASHAREYACSRNAFPAAEGGALLVIPDAFLARNDAPEIRARRAAALRCEAARLLVDARSLSGGAGPTGDAGETTCPAGGTLQRRAGDAGSSCSIHGTASFPVPAGDLPDGHLSEADPVQKVGNGDPVHAMVLPIAARWRGKPLEILQDPTDSRVVNDSPLQAWMGKRFGPLFGREGVRLAERFRRFEGREAVLGRLTGLVPVDPKSVPEEEVPSPDEMDRRVRRVEPR